MAAVALGVLALEFHCPTDVVGGVALGGTAVLWLTAVLDVGVHAWQKRPTVAAARAQKERTT